MRIFILLAMVPACLSAQAPDPCGDDLAHQRWDNRPSPVHFEAVELARELSAYGFRVYCVLRSKEEALFPGQQGAAWFSTDRGVFEVWILPKPESFDRLEAISQPDGSGFTYSFQGMPRIAITISSSKPIFFLPHGNVMFEVVGNEQLAASLKQAFQIP